MPVTYGDARGAAREQDNGGRRAHAFDAYRCAASRAVYKRGRKIHETCPFALTRLYRAGEADRSRRISTRLRASAAAVRADAP